MSAGGAARRSMIPGILIGTGCAICADTWRKTMMFGKKKELPKIEMEEVPEPPKIRSQVIEASLLTEDKSKLMQFIVEEYKSTYHGVFSPDDIKDLDADATSLNLLFAIYGEMRVIRELLKSSKRL